MSKFRSMNFTRIVCDSCGQATQIEPGIEFTGLECKCDEVVDEGVDTEISTPVQEELDYVKNITVTVIGRFENGDYEVINSNDATDSWRVPKDTFEGTYEVVITNLNIIDEVQEDAIIEETETNQEETTLQLADLKGKEIEAIKAAYNMDELRALAKEQKIKGYSNMRETKLVTRLLEIYEKAE